MPRVPTYGEGAPTVEQKPLGRPNLDSVASAEDFGAIQAKQQHAMGGAMMKVGSDLNVIAVKIQERENADAVLRAETAMKDEFVKQEQEWLKNRQGRFAVDLNTDVAKWFDEQETKHSKELKNPVQAKMLQERAQRLRQAGMSSMSRFQAVQLERSHDEAVEASVGASINMAAQTPTPESINLAKTDIQEQFNRQAARKGWEPEVTKAKMLAATTVLHENVLRGMIVNDPTGAAAYFEANKTEIDGKRHDELSKFAKEASATAIGGQTADMVWSQFGPKGDADPVNQDELETKAREALKGNESAQKAAITAIRERTTAFDKGTREREAANASAVSVALMEGKSWREVSALPQFLALSGQQKLKFKEHYDGEQRREEDRAERIADRLERREDREERRKNYAEDRADRLERRKEMKEQRAERERIKAHDGAYLRYSDPATLTAMSADQVRALLPHVGAQHTERLLQKREALLKDQNAVREAKVDREDFITFARGAGLDPESKNNRAALGEIQSRLETIIDQEQVKAKRPLTRAEKQQLMQRELDNKVLIDRTMWFDSTKPAITADPKDLKNSYVVVNGREVKLSSIPADFRAAAVANGKRTEQAIAEAWVRYNGSNVRDR